MLFLSGCGRKGPLLPPDALVPAAVQDLTVQQQGEEFRVSWSAPSKEKGGRPLRDLAGFRLYRRNIAGDGSDCSSCPDSWKLLTSIDLDMPGITRQSGAPFSYRDKVPATGSTSQYRLLAVSRSGGVSAPATSPLKKLHPVILPPTLQAAVLPAAVRLEIGYSPVGKAKVAGFNVYRRLNQNDPAPFPLNSAPLGQAVWEDQQVEFGRSYRYSATVLLEQEGEIVESLPSAEVELLFTLQELR